MSSRHSEKRGEVITFYSYKGGTGRTMALANTAVLLARREKCRVLVIDWDLEAPGLHHYFSERNPAEEISPQESLLLGTIEMLDDYRQYIVNSTEDLHGFFEGNRLERYVHDTLFKNVKIMYAGRLDAAYASKVAKFNFDALFNAAPESYRLLADELSRMYDYVLIDSRTGLNDVSGTCTSLLPSKLVAVFTPNRQSVDGVIQAARNAVRYREQSDDERPLMIYPLASRVEVAEENLVKRWRYGDKQLDINGYQGQFEQLFMSLYGLEKCNLSTYFNEIEIQHVPRYAFGEEIVVLREDADVRLSLARSYRNFVDHLTKISTPWNAPIPEPIISDILKYDVYIAGNILLQDIIGKIIYAFNNQNISTFNPTKDIKLGQKWQETIESSLHAARVFIFVLDGPVTAWVGEQLDLMLEAARLKAAQFIPVVLPSAFDFFQENEALSRYRALYISENISEDEIESLVAAVR